MILAFRPKSISALAQLALPELISELKTESGVIREKAMALRARDPAASERINIHRPWTKRSPEGAIDIEAQVHENGCVRTKLFNPSASLWQGSNVIAGLWGNYFKEIRKLGFGEGQERENRIYYEERKPSDPKAIEIRCDKGLIEELKRYVTFDSPRDAVELTDVAANLLGIVRDHGLTDLSPINIKLETEDDIGGSSKGRVNMFVNKSLISADYFMPNGYGDWNCGYLTLKKEANNQLEIKFKPEGFHSRSRKSIEIKYLGNGRYRMANKVREFSDSHPRLYPPTIATLDEFINH